MQSITRDLQEFSYAPAMNWFKDIMTQLHILPTENAADEVIKQLIIQLHEQMLINQYYQHDKTADSDSIYLIIIIFIQNSLEANDHIRNVISSTT